jgi:hypothetical protein
MRFTKDNAAEQGRKGRYAKAAVKPEEAGEPLPSPPMPASAADRQSLLQAAAWWVLTNDIDARPPDALHKNLQTMWKRGDTTFVRSLITPAAKGTEFEEYDGDVSDFLANMDKLLAEIRKPNDGTHQIQLASAVGISIDRMVESTKKNPGKFTKKNASKMGRKGAEARWGKTHAETEATGSAAEEPIPSPADGRRLLQEAAWADRKHDADEVAGDMKASGDPVSPDPDAPVPEAITVPARSPQAIQKPRRLAPLLCPRCRRHGYANCPECMLATDSSLAIERGVIFRVRLATAQDLWPWHRCKRCDNCFKAPQYLAPRFCPDCVAMADEDEAPSLMLQP